MQIRAVAFDAYGTAFDADSAVLEASLSVGQRGHAFSNLWRQRQLEFTWPWSLMGKYEDFWSLTRAALDSVLHELGVERDEPKLERLMQAYREPQVFPDVMPASDALPQLPLVILSNGSPEMLQSAVAAFVFMGLLSFERLGRAGGKLSGRPDAARLLKTMVSWLAPCRFQVRRWLLPQAFRGRRESRRSFLDDFQALGEQGRVPAIQVDVIRRCSVCLKAYGLADDKRNSFGFGFAYCLGGRGATLGPVQHLVALCSAQHKATN
jgi:2-haloalkanoic acid dehalogenase type II